MNGRWRAVLMPLAMLAMLAAPALRGQQANVPHAGYVYPAGGQQGTTVRIELGGQFLDGASTVLVSGSGVEAKVVGIDKPLVGAALTSIRDTLQAMQKRPPTPALQAEMMALRDRLTSSVRRNAGPALSELVTLEVAIAPNAARGERQLRLRTPLGLTAPLVFCVGELPEFKEKDVKYSPADLETAVTLPSTVNGRLIPGDIDRVRFPARVQPQYMPGDVDRYRFVAHKGQHLVFVASARALMPYLADAVPGWFQATLTLYNAQGKELAYNDDYRFSPDPVLHYEVPADGEYVLEIKDAIYRGREDFVYRIGMGELSYVTSAFPLGGRSGASHAIDLTGWNLPPQKFVFDTKSKERGVYSLAVPGAALASNRFEFAVDELTEVFDKEKNDAPKDAQSLKVPVIVNGRIDRPGDVDVFRFDGRAGDTVVAEIIARRLDSPFDSAIELTNEAGQRIAFNDDYDDVTAQSGRETHHADSFLMAALPLNGRYFLKLYDVQHKGGPEYAYRLRVSAPRPDFELRVSPSSINTVGGGTVPITVTALRRDGFAGDISLALVNAPAGFRLSGAVVPAGQDQVRMTLTVPAVATAAPISLRVEGRATLQGKAVARQAIPADDMTQAFAYHHLVTADELRLSIAARGGTRVVSRIVSDDQVRIPVGGSTKVHASIPPGYATFENLQLELNDAPDGFTLRDVSVATGGAQFVIAVDSAKLKPGSRGNLIVTISGERVAPANTPNAGARRRVPIGTLPAITFEIVKR
jgi:hypothetical protein